MLALLAVASAVVVAGQDNQPQPPKKGSIVGVVVDAKSGEPLRKATVILRRDQPSGIGATTDAAGKFAFEELEPGSWTITVEKDGFIAAKDSQRRVLTVSAGESTKDVTLKLVRTGAITGRVTDADGDPIAGANIQVLPARARKGNARPGAYATTNDRGEYRAYSIAPGDYKISVTAQVRGDRTDVRMQPPAADASPSVWYPAALSAHEAAIVNVESSADLRGYDIQLVRATGVRVRGHVAVPGGSPAFVVVMLTAGAGSESAAGPMRQALVRDAKGEFELGGVLPGQYRLTAVSGFMTDQRLTATRNIEVSGADIDGIQLTLAPPVSLTGRFILPEGRKLPAGLMVFPVPRDLGNGMNIGNGSMPQMAADGSFSLKDVAAGDYDLVVASMNASGGNGDDLYIAAIRMGDADALADGVRVGEAAPAPIEIVLKANGGAADCTVKDEKGNPVPGAQVHLVPDPPKQQQLALQGQCQTNAKGTCTITGITPGEYHVYALVAETQVDFRDPDAVKPFAEHGKGVKFGEGERQAVDLDAITDE